VLKELNSLVSVEDVEALLDENADQMAKAKGDFKLSIVVLCGAEVFWEHRA
jgi:hypothetical protein